MRTFRIKLQHWHTICTVSTRILLKPGLKKWIKLNWSRSSSVQLHCRSQCHSLVTGYCRYYSMYCTNSSQLIKTTEDHSEISVEPLSTSHVLLATIPSARHRLFTRHPSHFSQSELCMHVLYILWVYYQPNCLGNMHSIQYLVLLILTHVILHVVFKEDQAIGPARSWICHRGEVYHSVRVPV